MEAPDSLELFREKLRDHFSQFHRFNSKMIKIGPEYYFDRIGDEQLFDDQFRIHEQTMDLADF